MTSSWRHEKRFTPSWQQRLTLFTGMTAGIWTMGYCLVMTVTFLCLEVIALYNREGVNDWAPCWHKQVFQAGLSNHMPQFTVGCNYLSLPEIPASGNRFLDYYRTEADTKWPPFCKHNATDKASPVCHDLFFYQYRYLLSNDKTSTHICQSSLRFPRGTMLRYTHRHVHNYYGGLSSIWIEIPNSYDLPIDIDYRS